MFNWFKERHTVAGWLTTPLGRFVLDREAELAAQVLARVFGPHTLQVGSWGGRDVFLRHSNSRHKVLLAKSTAPGVDIVAEPSALAIASDSVDAVILPHTLEQDERPHETLREVQRVLTGDGHVVLFGFNTYSGWGLNQRLGRIPSASGRSIAKHRLLDWLTLLGLEPVAQRRYLYTPPLNHDAVARRAPRLERIGSRLWPVVAGAYMVVAKKRVYTALPLRPVWYRPRVVGGLVEPTTRSAA